MAPILAALFCLAAIVAAIIFFKPGSPVKDKDAGTDVAQTPEETEKAEEVVVEGYCILGGANYAFEFNTDGKLVAVTTFLPQGRSDAGEIVDYMIEETEWLRTVSTDSRYEYDSFTFGSYFNTEDLIVTRALRFADLEDEDNLEAFIEQDGMLVYLLDDKENITRDSIADLTKEYENTFIEIDLAEYDLPTLIDRRYLSKDHCLLCIATDKDLNEIDGELFCDDCKDLYEDEYGH